MASIAEQRARIAEIASRMIAKNPGNAGAIMQQLKDAGLDISGNPIGAQPPAATPFGGRPPTPPVTGFPSAPPGLGGLTAADQATPFGGTGGYPNSLRSMADRGDPSQAPDFRSRLSDARMLQGSATPMPGLATASTNPTAQVQGQLPGNFMSPAFSGNLPRTRPPEQLSPSGPPPSMAGLGPSSPLTGAAPPSPLSVAGPPAPIIGREAPPGLNGPPSPLASRFGDQSQLPGGAFSGSFPKPPQARPFESTIAARPMLPGGPGSLPAAPVLAGQPFTGSPGMTSRFGDNSQLASGAFSGGPPPPMASGPPVPTSVATQGGFKPAPGFDQVLRSAPPPTPTASAGPPPPLSPAAMDARVGAVSPETTLPPSAMDARVGAITSPAAMSNLQRAPLDLAAGIGAPKLPLGSTSMPFAGIPPSPASVARRTGDYLGPLPPGSGTGVSAVPAETPLGTSRGVPNVPAPALPPPPEAPPVPPPSMIASMPPANIQSGNLNDVLALSGTAPPPAIAPTVTGQRPTGTPRGKGTRQATAAPAAPVPAAPKPGIVNAKNIGTVVGGVAGLVAGGPGGAVAGATGGRVIGKIISAIRNRGQDVDAQGNILDKAGNVIGHISDMMSSAGSGIGGMWGSSGGRSMNAGGGWGGPGGWGGGSSYTGGGYGGNAGGNIGSGVGQKFGQR